MLTRKRSQFTEPGNEERKDARLGMDVVGRVEANKGGHEGPDAEEARLKRVDCVSNAYRSSWIVHLLRSRKSCAGSAWFTRGMRGQNPLAILPQSRRLQHRTTSDGRTPCRSPSVDLRGEASCEVVLDAVEDGEAAVSVWVSLAHLREFLRRLTTRTASSSGGSRRMLEEGLSRAMR